MTRRKRNVHGNPKNNTRILESGSTTTKFVPKPKSITTPTPPNTPGTTPTKSRSMNTIRIWSCSEFVTIPMSELAIATRSPSTVS